MHYCFCYEWVPDYCSLCEWSITITHDKIHNTFLKTNQNRRHGNLQSLTISLETDGTMFFLQNILKTPPAPCEMESIYLIYTPFQEGLFLKTTLRFTFTRGCGFINLLHMGKHHGITFGKVRHNSSIESWLGCM